MRSSDPSPRGERGRAFRQREAELPLRPAGTLRAVVVADTHSKPDPRAVRLIRGLAPDAILHAGDIGELGVLQALSAIAPVLAVRGNIDARGPQLPDALAIAIQAGSDTVLKLLLTHVAVHGTRIRADAARLAQRQGAGIIVCGHSHVPFVGRDRGLTVFNPGSIGPRRFHLPIVFGLLEIAAARLSLRHIDCETGREWLPLPSSAAVPASPSATPASGASAGIQAETRWLRRSD